jgi:hypothetical protein
VPEVIPTTCRRNRVTEGERWNLGTDDTSPPAESRSNAMKSKLLAALVLLLSSGSALAGQEFAPVQVRPAAEFGLDVSCANPAGASQADIEHLLAINDRTQTRALADKLAGAVTEACNAGLSGIAVERGANGKSLTWRPARGFDANVALN